MNERGSKAEAQSEWVLATRVPRTFPKLLQALLPWLLRLQVGQVPWLALAGRRGFHQFGQRLSIFESHSSCFFWTEVCIQREWIQNVDSALGGLPPASNSASIYGTSIIIYKQPILYCGAHDRNGSYACYHGNTVGGRLNKKLVKSLHRILKLLHFYD